MIFERKFLPLGKRLDSVFFKRSSAEWGRLGKRHSLKLFHLAAEGVPAYKDFLEKRKVNPRKIKTWQDFQHLPWVDKNNYLCKYPLEKLCWGGELNKPLVFTATSGSTGKPFYFPRDKVLDVQSSIMHKLFLKSSKLDKQKSTLVIVCFGMGVWIGGLITYKAFHLISQHGYPLTILTPGANKKEIFEALKNVGGFFDQIILCGYPPFIKDIIDEGEDHKINWRRINLRIVFAAEAFSETFRDYILEKVGKRNSYIITMNIYGSADLGTMAEETPVSILIRKLAIKNKLLYGDIFSNADKLPTLTQFNPLFTNFEADEEEILITAYSALPLIRYAIGDRGGVFTYSQVQATLTNHGIDIHKEVRRHGFTSTTTEMPFVYIYERSDMSTKLYGAIIYPEPVREALQHRSLSKYLTGKFCMLTVHDKNQDEYMLIHIELKPRVRESAFLKEHTSKLVLQKLLEKNAEFRNNYQMLNGRVLPKLDFLKYEHPDHFKPGIKQKWVKRCSD